MARIDFCYWGDQCVGGAEFVPSLAVPYPVPKGDKIAFLTCSFLSDEVADYRTAPLKKLEEELPEFGFSELIAVVSEDFARQHLVKKEL